MKAQIVSKTSNSMISSAESQLRDRPIASPPVIISKELNIYGKLLLFGLYTIICVVAGGYLSSSLLSPKEKSSGQFVGIDQLHADVTRLELAHGQGRIELMENSRFLSQQLEERLQKVIQQNLQESSLVIREQREQIAGLKNHLNDLLLASTKNAVMPSSPSVVLFSEENLNVLRYQHQLQKDNFYRQQKKELQAFVSTIDPSLSADQQRLQEFKDRQKLDAFALDQRLIHERKNFRGVGHRSIASVSE